LHKTGISYLLTVIKNCCLIWKKTNNLCCEHNQWIQEQRENYTERLSGTGTNSSGQRANVFSFLRTSILYLPESHFYNYRVLKN